MFAAGLTKGKRVLDIGGRPMPPPPKDIRVLGPNSLSLKAATPNDHPFTKLYSRISGSATEYRVIDMRDEPGVDYVLNLNEAGSVDKLRAILAEYRPEVILCMETLEHCNYHYEAMNEMARAVQEHRAEVFITLPNNGNWIFNFLGWNHDHCVAFFRDVAVRFVSRSNLGQHRITVYACLQKYLWYWWLAYVISFFQPFSWGFHIQPAKADAK